MTETFKKRACGVGGGGGGERPWAAALGAVLLWLCAGCASFQPIPGPGRDGGLYRYTVDYKDEEMPFALPGKALMYADQSEGFHINCCAERWPPGTLFAEGTTPGDLLRKDDRSLGRELETRWATLSLPGKAADFDEVWNADVAAMRGDWRGEVEVEEMPGASSPNMRFSREGWDSEVGV